MNIQIVSPLEKVMPGKDVHEYTGKISGFRNERISFQLVLSGLENSTPHIAGIKKSFNVNICTVSPFGSSLQIRKVADVPVQYTASKDADDNYISKQPGMYPDLLQPLHGNTHVAPNNGRLVLWVDCIPGENVSAGKNYIEFSFTDGKGELIGKKSVCVEVFDDILPPSSLKYTRWFHCDCLAEMYNVPVFSEEHWRIIENFIDCASSHGMNMILTPIHTPPLDTAVGMERLTTQLVDVTKTEEGYTFGMDKLRRWIHVCKKHGIRYFEMAHLFTQWGAHCAPKIVADVDGVEKRIFGWDTDADSPEYAEFLQQYIPAVQSVCIEEGIGEDTWWHVSDEPDEASLESYTKAKSIIAPLIPADRIMDALSHYEFYARGVVKQPVCSIYHLLDFTKEMGRTEVPEIWTYYCCSPCKTYSNQFIAMPSARTRILGLQLYTHNIHGFLHWGFNFYHAETSKYIIQPYLTTDGDCTWPAGDPFQVYPGIGGVPEESLRLLVTEEAINDMRALEMLESRTSRGYVLEKMEKFFGRKMLVNDCNVSADELLEFRNIINVEIAAHSNVL